MRHWRSKVNFCNCDVAKNFVYSPDNTEDVETPSALWQEVWLDMTPGTEAGVRLYLQVTFVWNTAICFVTLTIYGEDRWDFAQ